MLFPKIEAAMRKQCATALITLIAFSSVGLTSADANLMVGMLRPHSTQVLGHESDNGEFGRYYIQYRSRDNHNMRRGDANGRDHHGYNRDAFRDRNYWDRRHGRGYYNRHYGSYRRDNDSAIAAGFLGLILGAAIAGSSNDRDYARSRLADQDWIASCSRRYKSFDRSSGTYLGYDGYRHYCR
ncbi:MAG: BA14K family protein [Betaproteobacteria bacterium]